MYGLIGVHWIVLCAVKGFQLFRMPSHASHPGALAGIDLVVAARMTSTGRLQDPRCANCNKHSLSQTLGPTPKHGAFS